MPKKKDEGLLSDIATTIGSTLGAVASKATELTHLVKTRQPVRAKSHAKKVRPASRRAKVVKSQKPSRASTRKKKKSN